MKIAVVIGTRPEFIKMAPVVDALQDVIPFFIIHTGQHYSEFMNDVFFRELEIVEPKYYLGVGSGSHAFQTGRILIDIEKVLLDEKPDLVLVEGDTNSVLAGALAATKLGVQVGHVEAGLRCFDDKMPEEINRKLTDQISDFLFAPTVVSKSNLVNEGIDEASIHVTGNTIVDVVNRFVNEVGFSFSTELPVTENDFILLTLHRQENVDERSRLRRILGGLELVHAETKLPIIFPMHPRTDNRLKSFSLKLPTGTTPIEPLGYGDFLYLERNARLILTDSGGVQEEGCILGTPCVTLRDNTERPETVDVGANIVAGSQPSEILAAALEMMGREANWEQPFGDGRAGKKIVDVIRNTIYSDTE